MILICFSSFMDHKKTESTFLLIKLAFRQYWSSEQICLELEVWMSSFLNITSSRWKCPVKETLLKILQYSLKNIHAVVCTLTKFQNKGQQLYCKETPEYWLSKNFAKVLRTPIYWNADWWLPLKYLIKN